MKDVDAISVADLFCLYPLPGGASVAALRGMTLRVPVGERLVVHGPNGSGKTTLLRVLTGELAPSSGSARVAGIELADAAALRAGALRREVLGLIDQHSGRALRPELDVLDNVGLQLRLAGRSRGAARARATEMLGALGLDALAGRTTAGLSAGEAQRVAVCAAVAHEPRVLLADEPTGELDADSADAVYALLAKATEQAGATLLLVTHDPRAAGVADRLVRIRDGRLSEQWRPDDPTGERLVVDARGWVRLPELLRRGAGLGDAVRAGRSGDSVALSRDEHEGPGTDTEPATPAIFPLPDRTDAAMHQDVVAELRDVHVAYPGRVVLAGCTIALAPGVLTVVRGRSGAGKSTLLRLLLGLADPDAGEVRIGGVQLDGLNRAARADLRRRLVGVVTQSGALAETLDARENIALARTARGLPGDAAAVDGVLAALDLTAIARRQVRVLSGGERQRVAIARAVAVGRPIVLLDEPTSQQDEVHAELLTGRLAALAATGTAVLCATHDPVLVAAAGAIVELS